MGPTRYVEPSSFWILRPSGGRVNGKVGNKRHESVGPDGRIRFSMERDQRHRSNRNIAGCSEGSTKQNKVQNFDAHIKSWKNHTLHSTSKPSPYHNRMALDKFHWSNMRILLPAMNFEWARLGRQGHRDGNHGVSIEIELL